MGRDYARLASANITDCPLPTIQATDFGTDHAERLRTVKHLLPEQAHDQIDQAIGHLAGSRCLALTHGDPGSGNYLDDPTGGTILDWETAAVAPFGLDAGRAPFSALLDLGHTGDPHQLQAAFIHGYRAALSAERTLREETLQASILIAGLQFTHGRHTRPLRPDRTAQMAIDTMQTYLETR